MASPGDIEMEPSRDPEANDDLRPEYDLKQLKGGVRGKYVRRETAAGSQVDREIKPDAILEGPPNGTESTK